MLTGIILLAACGGDGNTGPNNGGEFFMRATVDGAWQSIGPFTASLVSPGTYTITGTQITGANTYVVSLTLYNIRGTGTYPLGVGAQVPGGTGLVSNASGGWTTPLSGAAGAVEITNLTSSVIAGTFSFNATATFGTGTKSVTNGQFNMQVSALGNVGPVPDNAGSTLSATVNNAAWNAAAVTGNLVGTPPTLTLGGTNLVGGITMSISNVLAPGTYPLTGTSARMIGFSTGTAGQFWTSAATGGSGSVTVSSITATRIRGAFNATLVPAPGMSATGTVTITNGTFDIGR